MEQNGEVVGGCRAVGECTVLCKFNNPCGVLGVKQITRTEIICNQREGACPDEVCDPGEDVAGPLQCPLDCGAACVDGQTGCVRSADGTPAQWDCHGGRYRENICPPGQRCEVIAQPANEVEFQGRCVDEASGAGGGGGAGGTGGAGGGQSPVCGNGIVEAGEICDDGDDDNGDGCRNDCTECGPERTTCIAGDTQGVRRCVAGEWVEESCEGGNICENGACRPPQVCEDGDARCSDGDGSAAREQCVDGQWTAPELCESGMVCVRGACEMACDEGLSRCTIDRTNATERCVNSVWVAGEQCRLAEMCVRGSCVSAAMMCEDGARRCNPDDMDAPQLCMNGNWTNERQCPPGTECQAGECLRTSCLREGRTRCSADAAEVLETCLADGSWSPERCAEGCGTPVGGEAQCMCNDRLPGECTEGRIVFAVNCVNGFEQRRQCESNCTIDMRGEARCTLR